MIEIAAAGVNRHDVNQRRRGPDNVHSPIPGLEVSGKVVAAGAGVTGVQPGDSVCALVNGGGYAQFVVANARQVLPVPVGIALQDAAALPEALFTMWHNFFNVARLQQGERIAVLSTGAIAGQLVEALKICRDQDMNPLAYQYHTVKPFDVETLAHIAERVDAIVTIEEHVPFGGFGAQVACHLSAQSHHPVLKRLSVADEFVLGGPHKDQMRRDYGLDAQGIAETLMALWAAPAAVNTAEGRQ